MARSTISRSMADGDDKSRFLALLDPDVLKAEEKYRILRAKLIFFFESRNACDPENLADEVLLRALRRLSQGVEAYSGLNAYCYGVAKNVLSESRRLPREVELPDEIASNVTRHPAKLSTTEQKLLLGELLRNISPKDRDLLTRYYEDDRLALAGNLGMTANALRIVVHRIHKRLHEKLAAKGASSGGI